MSSPPNNPNHLYVAIIAPFGSGKTTLMKALTARFKGILPTYSIYNTDHICIEQSLELYPGRKDLDEFIQSRILDNDATTIINSFKQTNESKPALFIADSSYHEHYCYMAALRKEGKLKSHHMKRLMFKYKIIRDSLPNPNMFIYLDVSISDIMTNIMARKRQYEVEEAHFILYNYISLLKKKYHNLFLTNRNYKYDHKLLQNVFVYKPGPDYHKEHIDMENYVSNQMGKIMNTNPAIQESTPISSFDKEFATKYIGGSKC